MDALGKFGLNLGLFLAYLINVVLMLFLLRQFAYKPIVKMLDTRKKRIAEGLDRARDAEQALASAEADRGKLLNDARAEAADILHEAREASEAEAKKIVADAHESARKIVHQAEETARTEREMALSDLREQIVSLSMAAATNLIGTQLDKKKTTASIKSFFTDLPEGAVGMGDSYVVITAIPLDEKEQAAYIMKLGVDAVEFKVEPAILGGAIIRSGGQEIDGSYLNQLHQMRGSLLS